MLIMLLSFAVATMAYADNGYEITWYTIDGGGETFSTGDGYELGGTIGQPDAGPLSGGAYTVSGGFWVQLFPDCNGNGVPDDEDIAQGTSKDCQPNDIPDECDIAEGISQDCQPNDIPDECEGGPWYYGDVDGDGEVGLTDLLCMLDGIRGLFTCEGVTFEDLDIAPCNQGNGDLNLIDLLYMLDALRGAPPCLDPCP